MSSVHTSRLVSRRRFLASSAVAAATATVPLFVPRSALGGEGRVGANERIGLGGVGIGRQGSAVLAEAIKSGQTQVVGIADVYLPRAEELCAKHGGQAYQDYRKLLDRKDVDAIITATPDHWRALVCIHACQAGKDIYAEKALCLTIREGRLIAAAARKYNRVLQVGSQQRSMAVNRITCQGIREGKYGKVREVIGHNYPSPWEAAFDPQPVPAGLDWDLWCGPAPLVPFHNDIFTPRANPGWLSLRPFSGGEMTGWGAHGLDQIQWALGMDDSGPIEVWTEGPRFQTVTYTKPESRKRGEDTCKSPIVFFRYAHGVQVKLDNASPGGGIFLCEQGKIDLTRGRVTSNPPEIAVEIMERAKGRDESHVGHWLRCIRTREKPNADVEIGHRSTTVCHLGNIARWVGRPLRWDPVKEQFIDDAEANTYLDRERRKPWLLPEQI